MLSALTPYEVNVALRTSYYGSGDLINWARNSSYLDEFADDFGVAELYSSSENSESDLASAETIFFNLFDRLFGEIDLSSKEAEIIARKLLFARMEEYLSGACKPYDVCGMVFNIEVLFDYPEWLGNMYDSCDWVEPNTKDASCPYLKDGCQEHLKMFVEP